MKRKYALIAAVLLVMVVAVSLLLIPQFLSEPATREFYVGVEYAYSYQFSDLKALVDKVSSYTNLFVLGSVDFKDNITALNESIDYIYNSGLHFIILFTGSDMYNYPIFDWMMQAQTKYGDKFLGIYRFDEPGGNQLDDGMSRLIYNGTSYSQVSQDYVGNLSIITNYYLAHGAPQLFTADYGLYWFDYECNYTAILGEFVGNQSRQRIVALNRGAAESFGRDWGAIINWKYDQAPYLETGTELYSDLSLAYGAGAKYAVVFSYPNITSYGTLAPEHFEALEDFWENIHKYPDSFPQSKAEVAYVIPKDYGFGFRRPNDGIWGLFPPDELSAKIWNDTVALTEQYGAHLNIIYDDPSRIGASLGNYSKVFYWNQTIT